MSEAKHPRDETEEERTKAYKELRKNIARQLRLHGVEMLLIPMTERNVSGKEREFVSPRLNQTFKISRTLTELEEPTLTLNHFVIDETDTMRETQYTCKGKGPFKRNDFSAPVLRDSASDNPDSDGLAMAEHLLANLGALSSGITGQPITAEETRSLIGLISDAEPLPDALGRTPNGWYA